MVTGQWATSAFARCVLINLSPEWLINSETSPKICPISLGNVQLYSRKGKMRIPLSPTASCHASGDYSPRPPLTPSKGPRWLLTERRPGHHKEPGVPMTEDEPGTVHLCSAL